MRSLSLYLTRKTCKDRKKKRERGNTIGEMLVFMYFQKMGVKKKTRQEKQNNQLPI